ncbi:hypothetical protein GCM10020260_00510 [Nesterenkonia halobia]|uniref:Uncharacterized protein n=1 Tax=Nesterenkonia halobia TaxID=37922 RepID=A0ABP6R7I9_9MICC
MLSETERQMVVDALLDVEFEEGGPLPRGLAEEVADGQLRLTDRGTTASVKRRCGQTEAHGE